MDDQQGNNKGERPQPRNLYRHKEHGGLYEVSAEDNGQIAIWPQGGGFQQILSAEDFASQYVVAPAPIMRRGTVTAEFLDEDVMLPCFSDGSAWNGWGMPRFDKVTALKIVSLMPDLSYNEATGIITLQFVGEEAEHYRPWTITCEGESIEVYEIGGGWTWDSVKFPELEDADPLGQTANEKNVFILSSDFSDEHGAAAGQFLVSWEGAGQGTVGKLVVYDGSEDARGQLIELSSVLNTLCETHPAPADVTGYLKARGFVDAAEGLAASGK